MALTEGRTTPTMVCLGCGSTGTEERRCCPEREWVTPDQTDVLTAYFDGYHLGYRRGLHDEIF